MKITVEYTSYPGVPYCAYTYIRSDYICGVSQTSFEDAKSHLLKSIAYYTKRPVPPMPEEVEV